MTYEDYAKMPDDGLRYELVDGRLELMGPSPERTHQLISGQLFTLLNSDCESEYVVVTAPVDVILSATEVRQPDLVMIHLSRMSIYKQRGSIESPPDLVVEILSPSSLHRDKVAKRRSYADFGVPEYWVVNPQDGTLEQNVLKGDGDYDLIHVYAGDELICSDKIKCITFSMHNVMRRVNSLPQA